MVRQRTKKTVFFVNSYPPETGGAAGRVERMAQTLATQGWQIRVVCAMPNYPEGRIFPQYHRKLVVNETLDGIRITRLWLLPSNSGNIWRRGISILSFLIMLFLVSPWILIADRPRKVFVSSPPLPMAFLATLMSRCLGRKVVLNVSDIWPLSGAALGMRSRGIGFRILRFMELFVYRHAAAWMGQSEEILTHMRMHAHIEKPAFLYRNLQKRMAPSADKTSIKNGVLKILYAGVLGHAQGLLALCRNLNPAVEGASLSIYGSGPEAAAIQQIPDLAARSIELAAPVRGKAFNAIVASCDCVIIPLRTPIHGALPSKLFMAVSQGKPVLFCGGGEGAKLVEQYNLGLVSAPGDIPALKKNIRRFASMSNEERVRLAQSIQSAAETVFDAQKQAVAFAGFFETV